MVDEKIRFLIDRLLSKTSAGDIKWSEAPGRGAFQTSFPNYSVEIEQDEDGDLFMRVYNSEGRIIEWISAKEASNFVASSESWPPQTYATRMHDLYVQARRQALRVEQAIDELLESLA